MDLEHMYVPFPTGNKLKCTCGFQIELSGIRNDIEVQAGRKIID